MTLYRMEPVPPSLRVEVVYATSQNFMGEVLYDTPLLLLVEEAAIALNKAYEILLAEGYGLLLLDGYRPFSVQLKMWNEIQDERYVSNPLKNGGRHTRGTAIDLTLLDLEGNEVEMPTPFDDLTERASYAFNDLPPLIRTRRALLQQAMERAGFLSLPTEWWHFDLKGWEGYVPLDAPLKDFLQAPVYEWENLTQTVTIQQLCTIE